MLLTDTGPLVALILPSEPSHGRCVAVAGGLTEPMLTTWPCMTETAYLLYRSGGWPMVDFLWRLIESGSLTLHFADPAELIRVREVMTTYNNLPCDLADASLVAAAESRQLTSIFTLDSHFYAYRPAHTPTFTILP